MKQSLINELKAAVKREIMQLFPECSVYDQLPTASAAPFFTLSLTQYQSEKLIGGDRNRVTVQMELYYVPSSTHEKEKECINVMQVIQHSLNTPGGFRMTKKEGKIAADGLHITLSIQYREIKKAVFEAMNEAEFKIETTGGL